MSILWLTLILVFLFAFFARYASNFQLVDSHDMVKPNILFTMLSMLTLVIVSGLRNNIGDTYFYIHSYNTMDFTWDYILKEKDIGFGILQMILQSISEDPQIMILVTAIITNILIVTVLRKYSRLLDISLYVYITGGMFLVTMNGIRQSLAAAIIFLGTKFLIEGRFYKYTTLVIIASLFHQSALILIPIYFLVRTKAWTKATSLLVFSAIIIVIGFDQFSTILFSTIENTQYAHYQNINEGGANIIRVIIYSVPLLIAFLGREKFNKINKNNDIIVNMSIIGLVFMIIATQNWIFARFTIYFNLYQILLVSWIVKLFTNKDQKFIYYMILIFYFMFYFYESVMTLNIIYKSDYLTW
ncbi:EpsG family protein [Bacillus sp. AK128]